MRFGQITPGRVETELTARGIYSETAAPEAPEKGVVIYPVEPVEYLQPVVTIPAEDEEMRALVPITPTAPAKKAFEIPSRTILIAALIGLAVIILAPPKALKAAPARREPTAPLPRVRTITEVL